MNIAIIRLFISLLLVVIGACLERVKDKTATREYINGTSLFVMNPNRDSKGIVYIFHSCKHRASDFFVAEEVREGKCRECLGLHNSRAVIQTIVDLGYTIAAFDARGNENRCWHYEDDVNTFRSVHQHVNSRFNPAGTAPIFYVGISSGGFFAVDLIMRGRDKILSDTERCPRPAGLILIVSTYTNDILANHPALDRGKLYERPPPTVFVGAYRAFYTNHMNTKALMKYQLINIPATEFISYPKAMHEDFFEKYAGLSHAMSRKLVIVLGKMNLIDEHFELRKDPRKSHWRKAAKYIIKSREPPFNLEADVSHISEAMNIAWGEIDVSYDLTKKAFMWLEERLAGVKDPEPTKDELKELFGP